MGGAKLLPPPEVHAAGESEQPLLWEPQRNLSQTAREQCELEFAHVPEVVRGLAREGPGQAVVLQGLQVRLCLALGGTGWRRAGAFDRTMRLHVSRGTAQP